MTKDFGHRPILIPVHHQHTGIDQLQRRPRKEKRIARNRNPYNPFDLRLRRNLINRSEGKQHRSKFIRKNGNLHDADDTHRRE